MSTEFCINGRNSSWICWVVKWCSFQMVVWKPDKKCIFYGLKCPSYHTIKPFENWTKKCLKSWMFEVRVFAILMITVVKHFNVSGNWLSIIQIVTSLTSFLPMRWAYLTSAGWTATATSPRIVSGLVVETTISSGQELFPNNRQEGKWSERRIHKTKL